MEYKVTLILTTIDDDESEPEMCIEVHSVVAVKTIGGVDIAGQVVGVRIDRTNA